MDCLVTKLKGVVNDDSLVKMDEFRIKFDMSSEALKDTGQTNTHSKIRLDALGDYTVSVIGPGYIGTEDSSVVSKTLNFKYNEESNTFEFIYLTDDVEELSITGKYHMSYFHAQYCRDYEFDISNLNYSKNLQNINIYSDKAKGDVSNLFKYVNVSNFIYSNVLVLYSRDGTSVGNTGLYGDITEVINRLAKNPNGLLYLNLGALNIHGTIKGIVSSNYILGPFCGDITLDLSGLNFSGKTVRITSSAVKNSKVKLTGDVSSLKSATAIDIIQFIAGEKCEISGDIIDAITGKYRREMIKLSRIKNTKVQDFSKLTSTDSFLLISTMYSEDDWHIPFTWTKNGYQGQYIIALESVYMQSHTEDMLVDMASKNLNPKAVKPFYKIMTIRALDLEGPTGNITSAISTLSGKGVTVGITYLGGSKEVSLMNSDIANKYAIVYKDNELIIEPTSLNNSTVAAAKDCIYKEFESKAEAEEFISINNLIKVESH